uniref:Rod shape-determining protein RodA n=1 Tax=candidate division WOR-3 bacterium TaxID=2052148 RepID=A0A7C4CC51_UNCW3
MNRRFELGLPVLSFLLTGIGLLAVYSAGGSVHLIRQLLFLPVAVACATVAFLTPRRLLYGIAEWLYAFSLLLLILVLFVGTGPGSNRWFAFGPLLFQPSELAKLATAILLAKVLSIRRDVTLSFRDLAVPVAIALAPALLIMAEPDLSTASVFAVLLSAMLYWRGLRPLYLLLLFMPVISFAAGFSLITWIPFFVLLAIIVFVRLRVLRALSALAVSLIFGLLSPVVLSMLKEYQRERIRSFFAPWFDPHGLSWNAIQSQIAIGSGRILGKGLFHGTQKRLGFLPNRHTDFIFSVIGEETGLVGSLILLGLFAALVHRILRIGRFCRDQFGTLLCIGFATIIAYQVFTNVGMLLGILPITGISLPFVSYGGSSLVLNFTLVGLTLNVAVRPE